MPYNYAWAVADPEAGLDFGQVPFPTNHDLDLGLDFGQVPFPTNHPGSDWLSSASDWLMSILI